MQILGTAPATLDHVSSSWTSAEAVWLTVWAGGLAATPVALVALLLCSGRRIRPVTRHALALVALVSFVTPAAVSATWRPDWLGNLFAHLGEPDAQVASPDSALQATADRAASRLAAATILSEPAGPRLSAAKDTGGEAGAVGVERSSACDLRHGDSAAERPDASRSAFDAGLASCETSRADPACMDAGTTGGLPEPCADTASLPVAGIAAPPPPASAFARGSDALVASLRHWLDRVTRVRDALVEGPPLPAFVWLAGTLLLLASQIVRLAAGARLVRRSTTADDDLLGEVRCAAASLELRRVPQVRVTDARVSPMVWCGLRPRLLLPTQLWSSLDRDSRSAVLLHELAHIRRGDHRWCWIEWLVLALYWWHPLVWWLRRRLREESETCCDAWVVALLPRARRAYAEALVAATAFLNRHDRVPSLGLGVLPVSPFRSPRQARKLAHRLARRITMVMTDRTAPRLSSLGALVALLALGLGAVVTPGLACPPEQAGQNEGSNALRAAREKQRRVRPSAVLVAPQSVNSTNSEGSVTFFGEAPAIDAMSPQVAELNAIAAAQDEKFRTDEIAAFVGSDGREVVRSYRLPSGKLDALVELMSRQDVPIFITAYDDHIDVRGTPRQQEIFQAFVALIHPEGAAPRSAGGLRRDIGDLAPLRSTLGADARVHQARARDMLKASSDQLQSLLEMRDRLNNEAKAKLDLAEATRERADQTRLTLETITERAAESDDPAIQQTLRAALESLAARSSALQREADQHSAAADRLRARLDTLEAQLAEAEARLEMLSEQLDNEEFESEIEDVIEPADPAANRVDATCTDAATAGLRPANLVDGVTARVPSAPLAPAAPMPALPPVSTVPPVAPVAPIAPVAPAPAR